MADDLIVAVGANIANLQRAMNQAAEESGRTADAIEKRFSELNPSVSFGIGVLKGALASLTISHLITDILTANKELASLSDTAKRVSTDLASYQALRLSAQNTGLSGKDADSGLEGLSKALNDSIHQETDLSKLFKDNNLEIKDSAGNAISLTTALGNVADLVRNAATEWDKVKIADAVGLTKDWIPLLQQGAAGIEEAGVKARSSGAIIDSEVIQKAKDFEREWTEATTRWSTNFKAELAGIVPIIDKIIGSMGNAGQAVGQFLEHDLARRDIAQNGVSGASLDSLLTYSRLAASNGQELSPQAADRLNSLLEAQRETNRASGFASIIPTADVPLPPSRPTGPTTNVSSLYKQDKDNDSDSETNLERVTRQLADQTKITEEQTQAIGLGTEAKAENTAVQKLLNAALRDGDDIGTKFKTAQDLINASTSDLTPEMAKQRTAILATADAYAKAEAAAAKAADAQKRIEEINRTAQDTLSGLLKDTLSNIRNGQSFWQAFENAGVTALTHISDKLIDMAVSDLFTNAFGGKGTTGFWGSLLGLFGGGGSAGASSINFGFASPLQRNAGGGSIMGPGSGTSDSILSWLSNGEYVVRAEAAQRFRPLLDAINKGLPGFADGGMVGMPSLPSLAGFGAPSSGSPIFNYAPQINASGLTVQELTKVVMKDRSEFTAKVQKIVRDRPNKGW